MPPETPSSLPAGNRDVDAAETLVRYIHWKQTLPTGQLTTAAFRAKELSVDRALLTTEANIRGRAQAFPNVGHVEFLARFCLRAGAAVQPDPIPENPAHALVLPRPGRAEIDRFAEALKALVEPTWDVEASAKARGECERAS